MTYLDGLARLAPVQLSQGDSGSKPGSRDLSADRIDACGEVQGTGTAEERLRSSVECLRDLGSDLTDAIFEPTLSLSDRQSLRQLLDEVNRRIGVAESTIHELDEKTSGGPGATALTNTLALVFGEATIGMHLRPRARDEIRGANSSRLAAATSAYGALKVFDRWALRGFASGALDALFEGARELGANDNGPGHEPETHTVADSHAQSVLPPSDAQGTPGDSAAHSNEFKWGNPRSVPTYGHTFRAHGQKVTKASMCDRARAADTKLGVVNECQIGAWNNDQAAADFLAQEVKGKAPGSVFETSVSASDGRALLADGAALKVDRARVVMRGNGAIKTAFPFSTTKRTDDES